MSKSQNSPLSRIPTVLIILPWSPRPRSSNEEGQKTMTTIADILKGKGANIHSVAPDATVYDAVSGMVEHNVGSLLVIDQGAVVGIVTERDYLRKVILEGRSSRETPVRDIMSGRLAFVRPDNPVSDVMSIMTEQRCRHLPVFDGEELAGLVSIGDCVKQLSSDRKARLEFLTDYINDKYPR